MRVLEMTLIVATALALVLVALRALSRERFWPSGGRRPAAETVPMVVLLVPLVLNLSINHYRTVMLPAYVVDGVLLVLLGRRARRARTSRDSLPAPGGGRALRRLSRVLAVLLGVAAPACSAVGAVLLPVGELPAPAGHYAVGVHRPAPCRRPAPGVGDQCRR